METIVEKRTYMAPDVEHVELDNEISLQFDSNPNTGPGDPEPLNP